jgi:hypothetical protein
MNNSTWRAGLLLGFLLLLGAAPARAQSTGTIRGSVADAGGGRIAKAEMTARQVSTNYERKTQTDDAGLYLFSALPVGIYRVEARSTGFRTTVKDGIVLDVNNIVEVDFSLQVGQVAETVVVQAGGVGVETNTMSVGHVVNQFTVQELPLNGRHFVDLALVAPGSVVPPTNGFLTAPLRGQGSFGVVTAGNREDTVNFQINGINLNDIVQNQITFQPSINTVQEFKLLNSVYSAEYGHTSGSVVNIATRSGTNDIHGELFEFFRNDALDAKNFFDNPTLPIPPFKRNQFGGAVGGPIWIPHIYDGRNKTFWFFSFEALRQRQAVTFSRQVLDPGQRASVTDPVSLKLLPLIPTANVPGTSNLFSGTGSAPVNINQWTLDISHEFSSRDRLHGYYAHQRDLRKEPAAPVSASTLPGFGDIRKGHRQVFTLNEWHTFGNNLVNEFRFGLNRILISFNGASTSDPATFGFIGLPSFGMPEIVIQETGLDFGGVAGFPQGRGDMTFVWADSLSWLTGKHTFRVGTELRRSYNNNLNNDTGQFTFSTIANFAAGKPSQFVFTQGGTSSAIGTGAVQFFAQDNYKWMSNLALELGFRYEMNTTPTERFNRFVEFDPGTGSLRRLGSSGFGQLYPTNHNFMPRVGFAWDPFRKGKTSIRGGYGIYFDQPVTNSVNGLSSNSPFANSIRITSPPSFSFGNPLSGTQTTSPLNLAGIDPNFRNAYVQQWNFNIQQEIARDFGIMVGYFGSKGTHLRLARNLNQPVAGGAGAVPFPTAIPVGGGALRAINVITEQAGVGQSNYNSLWVTASKRFSRGFQFNASYTYSKSIDFNSLSSQVITLQDSTRPQTNRGLSDFDARHHFVVSYLYELPFRGNRLFAGWAVSGNTTLQSGNPFRIVLGGSNPRLTNVTNTVRPNLVGNPVVSNRDPSGYFNPLAFAAPPALQFGNLGRNFPQVFGPGFDNVDFSVLKTTRLTERLKIEFRTEFFNIFNHPNFGQPGLTCTPATATPPPPGIPGQNDGPFTVSSLPGQVFPVGTCIPNASFGAIKNANTGATIQPTPFGKILVTRGQAGDGGSARQVQFVLKLLF